MNAGTMMGTKTISIPKPIRLSRQSSLVISRFVFEWSKCLHQDERDRTIARLVERANRTSRNFRDEERRRWILADWFIRECPSAFYEAINLRHLADELRSFREVRDKRSAVLARALLRYCISETPSNFWLAGDTISASVFIHGAHVTATAFHKTGWPAACSVLRRSAHHSERAAALNASIVIGRAFCHHATRDVLLTYSGYPSVNDLFGNALINLQSSAVDLLSRLCAVDTLNFKGKKWLSCK